MHITGKSEAAFVPAMAALKLLRPKHRRSGDGQPELRHAPQTRGCLSHAAAPAVGWFGGRRLASDGLALGAGWRGGAGGRAHRCRARVGRFRARRGGGALEAMARHGASSAIRLSGAASRSRQPKAGAAVAQRRALDRCRPARHAAGFGGPQHPRGLRRRSESKGTPGPDRRLAPPWLALAAALRQRDREAPRLGGETLCSSGLPGCVIGCKQKK